MNWPHLILAFASCVPVLFSKQGQFMTCPCFRLACDGGLGFLLTGIKFDTDTR